jgi:hypothetical protein
MKATRLALFLTAAICAGSCSGPDSQDATVDTAATGTVIGFDHVAEGTLPDGWRVGASDSGRPHADWSVLGDSNASSPPNVLSLTRTNHASQEAFNLCLAEKAQFGDGTLAVSVRADGGAVDQGGGPIWRVRDEDNYYVCRVNPLESNFRVYVVKNGVRHQLGTALAECRAGEWHRVQVEHVGSHITCSLDGQKLLDVEDGTFSAAGGVGVWTKADARTSFDDLRLP